MGLDFADRLNLLFRAFLKPADESGRRVEFTNGEVVSAAAALGGGSALSRQYLAMLRTGARPKPSLEVAYAIARAFEQLSQSGPEPGRASAVIAYLATDPTQASPDEIAQVEHIHSQLTQAIDMRDNQLIGLVARLGDLQNPQSLASVRALVDQLQEQERVAERGGLLRRRRSRPSPTS